MYYDRLSFLAPILDLRPTQSNLTERETGSDTEPIIDPVAGGEEVAGPSSPPPRSMGQVSSPDHPAPALACGPAPQTPPPGPHPQAGPSAAAPSTIQDDQGNISSRPTAQLQGSPQPAGPSQRGRRRQIPAQDSRTNVDTGSQQSGFLNALKDSPASVLEAVVCFFSMWSIVGLSGFHTYLISSNQTTNEDIKGSWSSKRGKENYNPYSYGNIFTNCCAALCGPMNPSLIDRRGIMEADMAQSVAPSNGLTMYGSTQSQHNMPRPSWKKLSCQFGPDGKDRKSERFHQKAPKWLINYLTAVLNTLRDAVFKNGLTSVDFTTYRSTKVTSNLDKSLKKLQPHHFFRLN
ncbi:palmitoyltransferase ZDHHC14 isoform X6 [Dendrobates tinctorius]|uniref:palmitoyltransferase ZDHHC14 isoform X6 n=1 Tax=Dendrobates tinctorius TaxID=92724 RepID=UPI003CCA2823